MYSYHAIVVLIRTTIDAFECLAQLSRPCIFHIVLKLQVSHSLMSSLICLGRPTGRTKAERWLQICFDPCLDISDPSRHALPDNIVLISIDHVSYQYGPGSAARVRHSPHTVKLEDQDRCDQCQNDYPRENARLLRFPCRHVRDLLGRRRQQCASCTCRGVECSFAPPACQAFGALAGVESLELYHHHLEAVHHRLSTWVNTVVMAPRDLLDHLMRQDVEPAAHLVRRLAVPAGVQ